MSTSLEPVKRAHILTIAGSDSSGGAGIQADLKTIEAFGLYGSSVLTGLTAQNTKGVQGVHEVPTDFVIQQLDSIFDDEPPQAIKIGMLTSASTINSLSTFLSNNNNDKSKKATTVLDPVMISTSGHSLLPDSAVEALSSLFPLVDYLTPNIPEARRLCSSTKSDDSSITLSDMLELAIKTQSITKAKSVLLKGGHASISRDQVIQYTNKYKVIWEEGDDEEETVEVLSLYKSHQGTIPPQDLVVDILVSGQDVKALFVGRKVDSKNTHGTGCTLSTAIACSRAIASAGANDNSSDDDVKVFKRAIKYTQSAIATAYPFGKGHGPLNHSHLSVRRALPPPSKHNPHPFLTHLIQSNLPLWKAYVRHPFVDKLGKGTLPVECFKHYITQDYHYLKHYARAHALGAYKANSFEDISAFALITQNIATESEMHVGFCEQFGISREQLSNAPESSACSAYARYIIDIGTQGDLLDLYVAVASCLVGYGEVGLWLKGRVQRGNGEAILEGNRYKRWMEDYTGEMFTEAINIGIANLEKRIADDPPTEARLARLTKIWHECVRLEIAFWDMGLNLSR